MLRRNPKQFQLPPGLRSAIHPHDLPQASPSCDNECQNDQEGSPSPAKLWSSIIETNLEQHRFLVESTDDKQEQTQQLIWSVSLSLRIKMSGKNNNVIFQPATGIMH